MKILHYTPAYAPAWQFGGPPRSVAAICEGIARLGHDVTVFTTNAGLSPESGIGGGTVHRRNGVTVHYHPVVKSHYGIRSPALESAVGRAVAQFDLLHVTGVWQPTSVAACRAAEQRRVPYIVSPRGALSRYSFGQKAWKKWPYWFWRERRNQARAAAIHATSRMEAVELERLKLGVPIWTVPNGIDFRVWFRDASGGAAWRSRLGILPDELVILYAGRFHHKKGLDLLPEAISRLPTAGWRVVLMGYDEDGTLRRLEHEMARRGQRERLIFLSGGDTDSLRIAYSGADVFVLPSRHENFGNVAVEALGCGCSVLLSDRVGAAEELGSLRAVSVRRRAPEEWGAALEGLLRAKIEGRWADPDQVLLSSLFSLGTTTARLLAHYQTCVETLHR
jgi:glycosyltransferase involved in cell wall biosynthesis